MKIQFLTQYYPPFLDNFLNRFPEFPALSYQEMLDLILSQYFADTGAAYHYAIEHGNESSIIIANFEILQKQWAIENNFKFDESNWRKEIAFAQVKAFEPTVFYIESIFDFYGAFIKEVRPFCKLIAAWISTPFTSDLPLNDIGVIFTSTQDFVQQFSQMGITSHYLLPAFDCRVLNELKNSNNKSIPLSFVGGWSDVHVNRKLMLSFFAQRTPIKIWGYGYKKSFSRRSLAFYKDYFFPENPEVKKAYVKEVWGLEMFDVLQRSLISLNIHESLLKGDVGNMRMFEASGVGTMLLNDHGNNVSQLFELDKEIVTYRNFEEGLEKYQYLADHPQLAVEIGLNAQKRTVKDYNYDVYIQKLMAHLKPLI